MMHSIVVVVSMLCVSSTSAQINDSNLHLVLTLHNKERASVNSPPLTWSSNVAKSAQRWSQTQAYRCSMYHSGNNSYGQNVSSGGSTIADLVHLWISEKFGYRTGNYDHYTQMVWSGTKQVGCGIAYNCGKTFLTCEYYPPGNVAGQTPFENSRPRRGELGPESLKRLAPKNQQSSPLTSSSLPLATVYTPYQSRNSSFTTSSPSLPLTTSPSTTTTPLYDTIIYSSVDANIHENPTHTLILEQQPTYSPVDDGDNDRRDENAPYTSSSGFRQYYSFAWIAIIWFFLS